MSGSHLFILSLNSSVMVYVVYSHASYLSSIPGQVSDILKKFWGFNSAN